MRVGRFTAGVDRVHHLLDEAVRRYGHRPAVRDSTGAWTYAELDAQSRRAARELVRSGLPTGSRVLFVLPGGRGFTAMFFGAMRAGLMVVPAVPESRNYHLDWLSRDCGAAAVITVRSHQARLAERSPKPVLALEDMLTDEPDLCVDGGIRSEVTATSPCVMIYTSGSTGRPKGIVCTHEAVAWTARAIASRLRYSSDDVVYLRIPISFDYGLYQLFLAALAGAEVVFPDGPLSLNESRSLRRYRATVVPVVPALASVLTKAARRDQGPPAIRLFTNTGAALVGRDAEQLRTAFPDASLVCMFGMSECKRISIAEADEDLAHPGTVGRALPGTKLLVVADDGRLLPPGQVGQIVSAGPHVMSGYWNGPDDEAERFAPAPDGSGRAVWTGDYGYLDDAGRLYFVGRRDEIFKRHGRRTSAQEIETAMVDIPEVDAAACIPPGPDGTLMVWAVTTLSPSEVLRGIALRLDAAKVPDRCEVVPELPRTPHGKVDKAALREFVGSGR